MRVVTIGDDERETRSSRRRRGGLQAEDVTVIKDIIISETGMSAGQIKIVEAA